MVFVSVTGGCFDRLSMSGFGSDFHWFALVDCTAHPSSRLRRRPVPTLQVQHIRQQERQLQTLRRI